MSVGDNLALFKADFIGLKIVPADFFAIIFPKKSISELNKNVYDNKIVTTLEPFSQFYKAEDYHQNYYRNNPYNSYCAYVVKAKVDKYKKVFG